MRLEAAIRTIEKAIAKGRILNYGNTSSVVKSWR